MGGVVFSSLLFGGAVFFVSPLEWPRYGGREGGVLLTKIIDGDNKDNKSVVTTFEKL